MARTFTLPKKGTGQWNEGWHTVTIEKAEYGTLDNGSKYIDVWFEKYPDNFNMRVYAKQGKDGEEFAIGNVFRFADAGITEALEGADGNTVVKLNDEAEELIGKKLNIFLYRDGKYSRALTNVAPTVFENIVEKFTEKDVEFWKGRGEKYFTDYIKPKLDEKEEAATEETADIPF